MGDCYLMWQEGCRFDSGATAAWFQAVLSAGAVILAWHLQDRAQRARDDAVQSRRIEGVANIAFWFWEMYQGVLLKLTRGMDPRAFDEICRVVDFQAARTAMERVEAQSTADAELTIAMINLIRHFDFAWAEIQMVAGNSRTTGQAIDGEGLFKKHEIQLFNAASSVERRAAFILRRPSRLQ